MTFDPDAFLAQNDSGFNPDAFLGEAADEIEQKMPDFISWKDRAIVKNFANSPQASLKYMQLRYPNAEFKLDANGEVIGREKGQTKWGQLDPSTMGAMELLRDAGDIAYDVGGAIAQGAATTAGAAAGLPLGGVGALATGSAASAASGAAIEAARQQAGKELGIPQEVSGEDVALSGAVGAIPLLTGVGKVGGRNIRGALGAVWDKTGKPVVTKMQSMATGIPAKNITTLNNNMDELTTLKKQGLTPYLEDIGQRSSEIMQAEKTRLGKAVPEALEQAGQNIDISEAQAVYKEALTRLNNNDYVNDNEKRALMKVVMDFKKHFSKDDVFMFGQQSPKDAFKLQQSLKDSAKFYSQPQNLKQDSGAVRKASQEGYHGLNRAFARATDSASTKAKADYADFMNIDETLPDFEDPQKVFNALTSLDSDKKIVQRETLNRLKDQGPLDLSQDIDKLNAWKSFYGDTGSNIMRQAPLAGVGGSVGGLVGYNTEGGLSGATAGGLIGAGLGGALGNRKALELYLRANRGSQNAANYTKPYLSPAVNQWLLLQQQEEEQIP
jgi:hypothetical protein